MQSLFHNTASQTFLIPDCTTCCFSSDCSNPEGKNLAASTCQCITQCMPMAFGTGVLSKI